jgi:hypothetical protein
LGHVDNGRAEQRTPDTAVANCEATAHQIIHSQLAISSLILTYVSFKTCNWKFLRILRFLAFPTKSEMPFSISTTLIDSMFRRTGVTSDKCYGLEINGPFIATAWLSAG